MSGTTARKISCEKIVGWSIGPTLEATYPLKALRQALRRIEGQGDINLIHHPDRGCRYASGEILLPDILPMTDTSLLSVIWQGLYSSSFVYSKNIGSRKDDVILSGMSI
jgi:hypothetical protein